MLGNVKFKGINSSDLGILLNYENVSIKPARRNEVLTSIGLDGGHIFTDHHDVYTIGLQCRLKGTVAERRVNARKISSWLQGFGELILGFEQDVKYIAYPVDSVNTALFPVLEDFDIEFLVQPIKTDTLQENVTWDEADIFWNFANILWDGVDRTFENIQNNDNLVITNDGNYLSKPIMIISGTATTLNLTVNGVTFTFNNLSGTITLDNGNYLVYSGTGTKVNEILNTNGEFLEFNIGDNDLLVTGTDISNVSIEFKDLNAYI